MSDEAIRAAVTVAGDGELVVRACDLAFADKVTRVVGETSGRAVFQVHDGQDLPLLVTPRFCPCARFERCCIQHDHYAAVRGRAAGRSEGVFLIHAPRGDARSRSRQCEHLLAVLVADATDRARERTVSEVTLGRLIAHAMLPDAAA